MKDKQGRRSFLKNVSLSSLTFTALPASLLNRPGIEHQSPAVGNAPGTLKRKLERGREYNASYAGPYLNKVAFPIGGIGAGMFCLEGTGAISHMSVRNRPQMFHEPGMFAAIKVKGLVKGTKVLEGPVPDWKIFGQPRNGNGAPGATYGLPRFSEASFKMRFPFGTIDLKDEDIPLEVKIIGWSPFTPNDADNSSLPVGALEYRFVNTGKKKIEAIFSYNARNFVVEGQHVKRTADESIIKSTENGFVLSQEGTAEKPQLEGNFAIFTDDPGTIVDHCWFRGGWWDPLTMAWNNINEGIMPDNKPVTSGAPGASLFVPFTLMPGEARTVTVMMGWYMPETALHLGSEGKEESCAPGSGCCATPADLGSGEHKQATDDIVTYKPWYSTRFNSIDEVTGFWKKHYAGLKERSSAFRDAFYASTLPSEVIEAVAANLTILKSPTVMRQHDGRMWNFEGCGDEGGCCIGSCTHVWNYAQAVPHLFPALERSLRHTEFCENQNEEGHQHFRANLPISPVKHHFHAAADGQLGGIMKVYREWRISGDSKWMKSLFPLVKQSLDYCIRTWDPRHKGVLEEPHHNTYDIEFWGADGMCTSFYLGALLAITAMGEYLDEEISHYRNLYEKGRKYMENELYNGEYFIQQIRYKGLNAPDPIHAQSFHSGYSEEALTVLQEEGPKYQYGNGCLSDGVLGGWIARMCGLADPLDVQKTTSHLAAVHKYNLKKELFDHVNPQRPGYALGDEGGLLLCTWPKGGKLSLPFVYSNEVWTGIEYQVASHLILMGKVEEGLEIVRTCRDRYDGRVRNPFNEYECGNWYARALSSYGLLQGLTGVRYDAVDENLYIDSRIGDFTSFISTEKGFGNISLKNGRPSLKITYGKVPVKKVFVSGKETQLS